MAAAWAAAAGPPPLNRTLLVRSLPKEMGAAELGEFFQHFGAVSWRIMSPHGRLAGAAFVTFATHEAALGACQRLHGFDFLGKTLRAEWARAPGEPVREKAEAPTPTPIAPQLGVDYASSPHLVYAYPPPSSEILHNISAALVAVPRLYVQVLHLMNKMNLPPPFGAPREMPPMVEDRRRAETARRRKRDRGLASDESELESDDEAAPPVALPAPVAPPAAAVVLPAPFASPAPSAPPAKRARAEVVTTPVISAATLAALHGSAPPPAPSEQVPEAATATPAPQETIISEPLERLPADVLRMHPSMRGYSRGEPCAVLFAKNIPKGSAAERIERLFAQNGSPVQVKMLSDRMRGQAFITFVNAEAAGRALDALHGVLLDQRPLILQFSRTASATSSSRPDT